MVGGERVRQVVGDGLWGRGGGLGWMCGDRLRSGAALLRGGAVGAGEAWFAGWVVEAG